MLAHMGMNLAAIHGAADRSVAVIVEHKVRMSPRPAEPSLNLALRLRDSRAYSMFRSRTVRIGRCSGDAALPLQSLAKLLFGLPNMLAQYVSAPGFVL